jgi:ankyrin repeat protein
MAQTFMRYGDTPLHEASELGTLDVVQYMVEKAGANIHTTGKGSAGNEILHSKRSRYDFEMLTIIA